MSLAPEHPLAMELAEGTDREAEVRAFIDKTRRQDKRSRTSADYEKEGVFTGSYCRNPVTDERMPVFVANFVVMEYGTGAVMAVPAHDQRDFEFAKRYDLPIRVVVLPEGVDDLPAETLEEAFEEDGVLTGSDPFNGLGSAEARKKITEHLEEKGLGKATVQYRLRDWCISRQRYWGAPIPVVYCDQCGIQPVAGGRSSGLSAHGRGLPDQGFSPGCPCRLRQGHVSGLQGPRATRNGHDGYLCGIVLVF